jgi:hypothetical protein
MTGLPNRNGIQNWLCNVGLRPDRTYRFKESPAVVDGEVTIHETTSSIYIPPAAFEIEFDVGCSGETLLESFRTILFSAA